MIASLDGMIARKDNSVSWFETTSDYENGVDLPGDEQVTNTIDCYIMGSRTYEHAVELAENYGWVYGDKPVIVLSKRKLPLYKKGIEVYNGNLQQLVTDKLQDYKNAWVVGGAELAINFIKNRLADELRISILPIILGEGLSFLKQMGNEHHLKLKKSTTYKNGMVELYYKIIK